MQTFETLKPEDWIAIADSKQTTTVQVARSTTGLPRFDARTASRLKPGYHEVPPTGVALEKQAAVEIITNLPHDIAGHWNRFVILVYRNGGRILFQEIDPTTLEAVIWFEDEAVGDAELEIVNEETEK